MDRSALGDFAMKEAKLFYIGVLRRMTPEQKWQAAFELWQMSIEAARAKVRADHPDWPETRVRAEIASRILKAHGATRFSVAGD